MRNAIYNFIGIGIRSRQFDDKLTQMVGELTLIILYKTATIDRLIKEQEEAK